MFGLLETVFFVLRKKQNQLSGLHIMHHSAICVLVWWFMRNPTRTGFYFPIMMGINMAVQCVIYTYYGLSSLGPHMAKYLWWKKYLTALQIGQFVFGMAYMFIEFLTGCEKAGAYEIFTLAFTYCQLIFFLNLYKKKYSS
ncbi:Elongation of very long chain fatty acids protein 7 [Araneus ventricosus]|uniref:Elongation of very long chain fatty acids protein n=1 Tax=Araneus ventricosus TaxID=182803 RepID=A0A4Y2LB71_ARAVE|nr:Elongation of very long chain fatty acids protein 7 [Araneus ventricosus]